MNGVMSMDNFTDFVGEYACPVDPMEALQCDSCQQGMIVFSGFPFRRLTAQRLLVSLGGLLI